MLLVLLWSHLMKLHIQVRLPPAPRLVSQSGKAQISPEVARFLQLSSIHSRVEEMC